MTRDSCNLKNAPLNFVYNLRPPLSIIVSCIASNGDQNDDDLDGADNFF